VFSTFLFILILANLGFPGTLNFIGELLGIISLASVDFSLTALFLLNVLLTACYSLFLYERICFGKFIVRKTKLSKLLTKPFYLNS
jgi:NADH:ubiquinone oxidoreductase subunit 4 (subunit M)